MVKKLLNGYMRKRICLLTLWIFLISTVSFGQNGQKIRVGLDNSFPPYEFIDSQGKPSGFNIDLIQCIANELNIEVEFISGVWNEVIDKFNKGKLMFSLECFIL